MKRIPLFTLLLIGAMGTCAFAQSLSFGVRGGVDYAAASTGSDVTVSPHPSAIFGGSIELEVMRPLIFQVGIQYAEKRTTLSHNIPGLPKPTEADYSLNYFEIPVTLKLAFGGRAFQVYGLAGANVGTLVRAVRDSPLPGGTDSEDIKASLDRSSVGLELGGGIGFQVAPRVSFVVDGRYDMGLKDINRSGTAMIDAGAWKPRDLRITAGLTYRIGR